MTTISTIPTSKGRPASPYRTILGHWNRALPNTRYKIPFLLTKIIEIYAFSKHKGTVPPLKTTAGTIVESQRTNNVSSNPSVSVVVPAFIRNPFERDCLERLTECLLNQTKKIEQIIIVDDRSPYNYETPKEVNHHRLKKNQGPARARNKGIEIALSSGADIILFTDVDCVPTNTWAQSFVQLFLDDRNTHILSGNTRSFNKNWLGRYHEINGTLNGRKVKNSNLLLYGPTCNLAITNEVAQLIRFNATFPYAAGEDIEFCFRAIEGSFNIKFCKEAVIFHDFGYARLNIVKNLRSFFKQFERYARGETILLQQLPEYYSYLENTVGMRAM